MYARMQAELDLSAHGTVAVGDGRAARRFSFVDDHGAFGLDGELQPSSALLEDTKIPLDLRALFRIDVLHLGEVAAIGVDRLAVALELHGTEPGVAEDAR